MLGYASSTVTASVPGFAVSTSNSDMSYGFGMDYEMGEKFSANAEFTSYYSGNGVSLSAINLGVTASF